MARGMTEVVRARFRSSDLVSGRMSRAAPGADPCVEVTRHPDGARMLFAMEETDTATATLFVKALSRQYPQVRILREAPDLRVEVVGPIDGPWGSILRALLASLRFGPKGWLHAQDGHATLYGFAEDPHRARRFLEGQFQLAGIPHEVDVGPMADTHRLRFERLFTD